MAAKLKITLVKSANGYREDQKATLRSLGLRKLHHSVVQQDSASLRGMVLKVKHLVMIEEVTNETK